MFNNINMDKKVIIIIVLVLTIIVIGIVLGIYFYRRSVINNQIITIDRQSPINMYTIFDQDIVAPKDGFNYSIAFFIYLDDYVEKSQYWRHILHKGTELNNDKVIEYKNWNNLKANINEQSPGIWLIPNSTKIRISFTTHITKKYCKLFNRDECNEHCYCKFENNECINNNEHPKELNNNCQLENNDEIYIEYVDMPLEYKKIKHFGIVLENEILNVYLDGKLFKTHKFMGKPLINKGTMYFNKKYTADTTLFNFRYFPYTIDSKKIISLYKETPNVEEIPKSIRINKYLKTFRFGELFKSFFI